MQARLQLALYLPGWYSLWVDAVHTANTKKCEEEIMMLAKEFTFEVEGGLKIFVRKLLPEAGRHLKGIVLIAHGAAEHSARYVRFGKVLNENGFVVYAHDQRGHGQTAANPAIIHINEGGFEGMVDDIDRLYKIAASEHPGLPIFLFAHSMGTIICRKYLQKYSGRGLKGTILCGAAHMPQIKQICDFAKTIIEQHGRDYVDVNLQGANQSYNERFQPERTPFDWLSRDEAEVDKYIQDPLCGNPGTAGFLYEFAKGYDIFDEGKIKGIDKELPILFITGDQDPSTLYGESAKLAKELYQKTGIKEVDLIIYPGARHELLNEINRDEVTEDIIDWINKHL